MKLTNYGITLQRLTEDKIEQVRNWRNDPKIALFMEHQDYIDPEMQIQWFRKINNDNNFFFIIVYEEKEIGLINLKDIDYTTKEGEGGIFIFDDRYLNSDVSFRATLCMIDFGFETLHLKSISAHILTTNKRAILFNKSLGFIKSNNQEGILNQLYHLTVEEYLRERERVIRLF